MESPVTIVTSLFYLAREKWKYSGFPPNYDRYLSWSENSLSLNANFVIFVDDHYYHHIESTRRKYDPDFSKTKIYRTNLSNLGFYEKFYFKMAKMMSSPQFTNKRNSEGAEVFYPSYNIIQYNKIDLLKKVKNENPFNTSHLMWMDIGATRDHLEKYKGKKFPTNFDHFNDKIIHFSHNTDFRIDHKQEYFMSQVRNIHGGYFIIPNEKVDIYYDLIYNELNSVIEDGYIGSDEKCYDSVYLKNTEHFQLIKAGWFQFYDILTSKDDTEVVEKSQSEKKLTVVVNHYHHNVKWTKKIKHHVVVYNKNEKFNHLFKHNLPNVGFDTIVYLKFIVDNYDNLPDYIAFSQDDPFYHCTNYIELINNFQFDRQFVPLGITYELGEWEYKRTKEYAESIGLSYQEPIKFINAAQCIVSKDLVLKRPKEMYEKIISTISSEVLSSNNFCIEYLWPTIFNCNQELIASDCNCAGGGIEGAVVPLDVELEPTDNEVYF